MKRIILFFLLFFSSIVFGQLYKSIEKEAANIFLMNKNYSAAEQDKSIEGLEKLKAVLFSDNEYSKDIEELRNHFTQFEVEAKNISVDSALFLFNQWYLKLSNTFYNYCKEKFFSSNKTKIILFSASMSCYCTLEMCKNQTIDILKFVKDHNNEYEYWIVDSYEHNELQLKYETYFAPSVIVFDGNNQIIAKIEYEENMIEQLAAFLNIKKS
jgi:hypothetical protein